MVILQCCSYIRLLIDGDMVLSDEWCIGKDLETRDVGLPEYHGDCVDGLGRT
jgi:hypothetical protein